MEKVSISSMTDSQLREEIARQESIRKQAMIVISELEKEIARRKAEYAIGDRVEISYHKAPVVFEITDIRIRSFSGHPVYIGRRVLKSGQLGKAEQQLFNIGRKL